MFTTRLIYIYNLGISFLQQDPLVSLEVSSFPLGTSIAGFIVKKSKGVMCNSMISTGLVSG